VEVFKGPLERIKQHQATSPAATFHHKMSNVICSPCFFYSCSRLTPRGPPDLQGWTRMTSGLPPPDCKQWKIIDSLPRMSVTFCYKSKLIPSHGALDPECCFPWISVWGQPQLLAKDVSVLQPSHQMWKPSSFVSIPKSTHTRHLCG
jgi:hypothetical protein